MTLKLNANFMGGSGIEAKGSYEPQRTYCGFIFVPSTANLHFLDDTILALSVDSYTLPSYGVEVLNLGWMNEEIKFPGKATVDELTWILRDFVDINIADMLAMWHSHVFNPLWGTVSRMRQYKTNAYAILLDQAGSSGIDRDRWYRLEGAYPSRIERGDIDHTGSDYVKITVTLSIDRVVPLFLDLMTKEATAAQFAGDVSVAGFGLPVPII